jgi:hypothetical protein
MSGIAPRIDTIESQVAVAGVTYIGNASGESGTTGYTVYSERKTFTVTIATPGVFTVTAHGYSDGDAVSLSTTGALPTGLAANTVYYVVNKATNTFNLSTTLGGSAIATSGTQSGVHTIGPVVAHVGTGGVAAGTTLTVSNINPLRGLQSFIFSKDAANRMGEGASYNFTIDRADLAKVLTVGFEYQVNSGTLNDGDVRVYLVQDPNGVPSIIQPAGLTVLGATAGVKMRHVATFQSDFTAREYRLCIHVASTSVSAWSLGVDSISVGPQQKLYGAPITDWVSARAVPALVGSTTNPTTSSSAVKYRRIGDSYEISWYYSISTAGSGEYRFQLPDGLTIDTAKLSQAFTSNSGSGRAYDLSTGINYNLAPRTVVGVTTYITLCADNVAGGGAIGSAAPVAFAAGDEIWATVILPIAGLSSTVQMSNDTDTRVVAFSAYDGASVTATNTTVLLPIGTTDVDTHATRSSNTYVVPVSGFYRLSGKSTTKFSAVNAAFNHALLVYKNGNPQNGGDYGNADGVNNSGLEFFYLSVNSIFRLNAGDIIDLRYFTTYTGTATTYLKYCSFERLSGNATIAASESVSCKYGSASGYTLGNVDGAIFSAPTRIFDSHSAYNPATGYTVPVSGKYLVNMNFILQVYGTASTLITRLQLNGVSFASGTLPIPAIGGQWSRGLIGTVDAKAGDIIKPVIFSNAGSPALTVNTFDNYIEIVRVGN